MDKRKILVFILFFIVISIYTLVNHYLMNISVGNVYYSDVLYYDLKDKYNDLATKNNILYDDYSILGAAVIQRNIYSFFDEIIINRGSNDNIKVDDAVVNSDGLVGVVSKVYEEYSVVNLITNDDFNISVKINDSYGTYNNGIVSNIINYDEVNVGDYIYTSGLTNVVGSIYIGRVDSISLDKYEIEKKINVDLIDIGNLRHVYVIVGE